MKAKSNSIKTQYKSWDRPWKNVARDLAQPTRLMKRTLWMPGWTCLDILDAHKHGLLDRNGQHVVVECNPNTMCQIKNRLKKLPYNFVWHIGELSSYVVTSPLDYFHVDYCGGIDFATACWISNLSLAENAEVNFTFAYAPRANTFIKNCREVFSSKKNYHAILVREYVDLNREDMNIAVYCAAIRCFLRAYSFNALRPTYYKDEIQSMVLYQFKNFIRNKKIVLPDLTDEFGGVPVEGQLLYFGG